MKLSDIEEAYHRHHYVVHRVITSQFKGLNSQDMEEAYAIGCACLWQELNKPVKELPCALSTYLRNQVTYAILEWLSFETTGVTRYKLRNLKRDDTVPKFVQYEHVQTSDPEDSDHFLDMVHHTDDDPLTQILRKERSAVLNTALGCCTPKQRQAVVDHVWNDTSFAAMGRALGMTAASMQDRYNGGINQIKKVVNEIYRDDNATLYEGV